MKTKLLTFCLIAIFAITCLCYFSFFRKEKLAFTYPFQNAVFPAEFPSPVFRWMDDDSVQKIWDIQLTAANHKYSIHQTVSANSWKPEAASWDSLKKYAGNGYVYASLKRYDALKGTTTGGTVKIVFSISSDKVGAPILYREVVLPFVKAETMLDSMTYRLCDVGSPDMAHVAMKGFPVCGNCHSGSLNGQTLALDLDAGNRDKGGYFIANIKDTIVFNHQNYLSWTQLQHRSTFGMFSKLSPDGQYVVTTMKDRVFVKNYDLNVPEQIKYSQLFFPVNGVLGIFNRKTGTLKELPGANDRNYVQTNAIWSSDGKYLIFARAKALPLFDDSIRPVVTNSMLINEIVSGRIKFQYDLYMIPFNDGKGGTPVPIRGASGNGKSNYFPAISPDSKWLVFCQADNFMLLMPDSKLNLVNLKTGGTKLLACNLNSMNSWHAWSPNGKWLVFTSKALSPYTDLFLTHIDDKGNASVPVLIENAHRKNYAANYPEFINTSPSFRFNLSYRFVEITHVKNALYKERNIDKAKNFYHQFLAQGTAKMATEYIELARIGMDLQDFANAYKCLMNARKLKGNDQEISSLLRIVANNSKYRI